jgi:predicted transposase YbfD/YdcC
MSKLFVDEQKALDFKDAEVSRDKTVDGDHGRIESTREVGGKIDREMRLYITSLVLLAKQISPMIRADRMIENSLRWVLDMIFRDDECRVRTDNAPANLATIKHMACNVMRRAATRDSMRLRRKVAAWDDDFLASLIAAWFLHSFPCCHPDLLGEAAPLRAAAEISLAAARLAMSNGCAPS